MFKPWSCVGKCICSPASTAAVKLPCKRPASKSFTTCVPLFTTSVLMASSSRRVPPPPSPQEYYAVPQSPTRSTGGHTPMNSIQQQQQQQHLQQPQGPRPSNRSPSIGSASQTHRGAVTQVATGAIGGGYGPYSVRLLHTLHHIHM